MTVLPRRDTPPEVRRELEAELERVGEQTQYYDEGSRVVAVLTSIHNNERTITMLYMLGDNLRR